MAACCPLGHGAGSLDSWVPRLVLHQPGCAPSACPLQGQQLQAPVSPSARQELGTACSGPQQRPLQTARCRPEAKPQAGVQLPWRSVGVIELRAPCFPWRGWGSPNMPGQQGLLDLPLGRPSTNTRQQPPLKQPEEGT
ncbi:hypothetical protein KIL84_008620 [Mauremys mutica]|uniref:Uncharacterized protein n=1 Tax=Mauremys mutica TaxID=74926 RepID=A0A9D4AYL3_9SAUR|nr:hypothetical protein KIL84_008620 [Mauremys mutica]